MESSHHYLPPEIRQYIIKQWQKGLSYSQIVDKVETKTGRTTYKGTVSKIIDKFRKTNSIEDLPRLGSPHCFTPRQEETIINAVLEDRKLTAVDISRDKNLNKPEATERTIRNVLANDGLIASARPLLLFPPDSAEERLVFAAKYINSPEIWRTIIFSDETYSLTSQESFTSGTIKEKLSFQDTI